jgi:peptidoglycan/xylan/chitin deacetylase (PgdA/CDA1 family)
LRKDPPLLDTNASPILFIVICRLFLFLCVCLAPPEVLRAQAQETSPTAPRVSPLAATERAAPGITFTSVHVDEPYIALTFDDGPHAKLTPKLLDLLAARRIKATFFLVGQNAAEYPDIVRRTLREGHEIASHSWSHPNLKLMSDDAVRAQMRRTDEAIKQAIGKSPRVMRPPYGELSARQARWINAEFGYKVIMWDVDPLDWKRPGPTTVCNRIVRETRSGSIVLAHDIHPGTIEAMPATLDQLKEKNFRFVTVSELLDLATPEPPKPAPTEKPRVQASGTSFANPMTPGTTTGTPARRAAPPPPASPPGE